MGLQFSVLDLPVLNTSDILQQQIIGNNINNISNIVSESIDKKLPLNPSNKSKYIYKLDDIINQIKGSVEVNQNNYAINNNYYLSKNQDNSSKIKL